MVRIYEMKQKEVINVKDGCRIGFINDLLIDEDCGKVAEIIVPGPARMFGILGCEQEFHIPWGDIVQIGDDLILVDVDSKKILIDCD